MNGNTDVKSAKLEDIIVETEWTDRDDEIVVESMIDRQLGLEPKTELD